MTSCPICSQQTNLVYKSFLAYQQGQNYDIYFCENCDSSHANPLKIDEDLYNYIYTKAKILPGYDRYYRFADDVLKVKNPLLYLAETEDTYWAIYDYVINYKIASDPKILEVGCGLGYLTYSLVKSGYNVKGVDISKEAVQEATRRYGKYYEYADIYEYSKTSNEKFDIIILTEVIEHIPDPVGFIAALKDLLSVSGRILVTTPNKDKIISKEMYWDTELPPVHLWWLSKKSFQSMASKLNLDVAFTDFTNFQKNIKEERTYSSPWRQQTLSSEGEILFNVPFNSLRYYIRRYLISHEILNLWRSIKGKVSKGVVREDISISDRLCAILKKKE
ncbi:class I SAM-dependent methyltransferase [Spirosoma linguale]|uniref:Methyltransferase type 11 n=1 Tax=Spirosoma linguale (strain ATCC 33905 / DSM 74 / LMG 10896 / Claus 1) TaxID=504472 RepID=D2QRK7_SPILD|nr:Methyltransferase type 11 [Spirosoma linguale DSM 74]